MSRLIIFKTIVILVLLVLLSFEWIIYQRWKKRFYNLKLKKYFSIFYWSIIGITHFLFLFFLFSRNYFYITINEYIKPIYYFFLSWNYAFFFGFFLWLAIFIILYSLYFVYKFLKKILFYKSEKQANLSISRKAFLTGTAGMLLDSTPFFGTIINFSGMYLGSNDFQIFKKQIKVKNLDPKFFGFRIVQISDIHIGSLINEQYLRPTFEIIKSLKPNCIVVTGDILDNSAQYLNIVGWYFRKLNEISPVYAILGNHDHIDSPLKLLETLKLANTKVLVNESTIIKREKAIINIIGLDYPFGDFKKRMEISKAHFKKIYDQIQNKEAPIIVLDHHPANFEYLKYEKIDLVLAGHTHGGQIMLSKNRNSTFSLGSNFLKYYVDHYKENEVQLYVNRGLGHWFPLRINCPPEITLIELI